MELIHMQQIQFMPSSTSWNDQTNSGCIVENVDFNQVSIIAKGCSPKITNNVFNNPIWMAVLSTGGSPSITNNVIQNVAIEGISVGGSSTLQIIYCEPITNRTSHSNCCT